MDWFYWERESFSSILSAITAHRLCPRVRELFFKNLDAFPTRPRVRLRVGVNCLTVLKCQPVPACRGSAGPVCVGGVTDDLTRTGLPGGDNWKTR